MLCWAHVRNRFESAFLSAKDKIADWFVKKIAELYRIENIRPFTVHRKNAVSYGSEDKVKEACVFFTLCETCKQYGINFKEYITHAVKEIINGNTNYETLVPWAIKLA